MREPADTDTSAKPRGIGRPATGKRPVGREALIDATCELLRTMPHTEVTRVGVARHAGVDPSLIKYYFGDRGSLLAAAAEKLMFAALGQVEAEISPDIAAEDLLRARITALFALHLSNPFFHRLVVDEVVNSDRPASRKVMRAMTDRGVSSYGAILDIGIKAGTMRPVNLAFLYMSIVAMCEFFMDGRNVLNEALGPGAQQPALAQEYLGFMLDLIMNGIRARD